MYIKHETLKSLTNIQINFENKLSDLHLTIHFQKPQYKIANLTVTTRKPPYLSRASILHHRQSPSPSPSTTVSNLGILSASWNRSDAKYPHVYWPIVMAISGQSKYSLPGARPSHLRENLKNVCSALYHFNGDVPLTRALARERLHYTGDEIDSRTKSHDFALSDSEEWNLNCSI